ncbi:MAG: iron-containing alcohol dehydrogenase [Bryobacteraceae bacterium]
MQSFDFQSRTRAVFGPGKLSELGALARDLNFQRTLLVCDSGLVAAGYARRAARLLNDANIEVFAFHEFAANPDSDMVENGRRFAADLAIDSIVGLGGGSSMDCAKAINFLLTNGGRIQDYWGYGKASRPMLPAIGIPTTAGTGSEAQCYALISDVATHVKMACGDTKAAFRTVILDPELTVSQPQFVAATAGYDAISHAVETWVSTRRNPLSECFSREAWRLLEVNYTKVMAQPEDIEARGAMQIGAHFAGLAIENSMLGAAHACANPLTARYGTEHGAAIAVLLEHVVRWNEEVVGERYRTLGPDLAARLRDLASAGGLPGGLRGLGTQRSDLPQLAADAATQWTGRFNPRPFDAAGALEIYQCAF